MSMRWVPLLFGVSLLAGCSGPECDSDGLTAALAQAESGDVVRVGSCRIAGQFTLPAGAALVGEAGSVIEGKISLFGGGRVESVAIESNAQAIVAKDGGDVVIRDVRVAASKGIGIAVDGVASLAMEHVELRGPVDASNVGALAGSVPDPMQTATHGLILVSVPSASLSDVSIRGFARFGALLKSSTTTWMRGDSNENAWVGIMVAEGSATLSGLEIHDTFDLQIPHATSFGVVTGTAAIDTTSLSVARSAGFGLFHLRGTAVHRDLTASENAYGAVRLELTMRAELGGTFSDNDFGAIVAYGARDLTIRDAMISNSAAVMREQAVGTIEAGDGIQLVDSTMDALIADTEVSGNDRAGIVIDLFGQNLDAGLFDNVTVSRDDPSENGVIVQGGTRAADWDLGLLRDADTAQADDAFTGTLDTVGAVGPCFFPAPQQ